MRKALGDEWRLEVEALAYLILARIALRFLPFRWLRPMLELRCRRAETQGPARTQARREVRRAVRRAALRLPGTSCFPRAIAAQAMLRRRSVSTTLFWGARTTAESKLEGHVWVQDGAIAVAGGRQIRYHPLATFPSQPSTRSV